MKEKLSQIKSPWLRFYITFLIVFFYCRDKFRGPRARAHWVGYRRRPVRPERHMIALLFFCAMIFLEPRDVAVWAAIWGGVTAIVVIMATIYIFSQPYLPGK